MFDYSQATVRPWPEALPFGSRHTYLLDVHWTCEQCAVTIERDEPSLPKERWKFVAEYAVEVIIHQDERQAVGLWVRRDETCPGADGYLVVEKSPILAAVLKHEPHLDFYADICDARHFVIGTDSAVAHILSRDVPKLTQLVGA